MDGIQLGDPRPLATLAASLGPQSVRQCLGTEQRTQQASLYELLPHVDNAITVVRRAGPHLVAYQRGQSSGGEVPEGAALPPGRVQRSEFTSNKLAPKLAQQLKVLRIIALKRTTAQMLSTS